MLGCKQPKDLTYLKEIGNCPFDLDEGRERAIILMIYPFSVHSQVNWIVPKKFVIVNINFC
jgi:hypothetical protein